LTLFNELEEEGELMTAWDYNEQGELVCIGYAQPKDGKTTTKEDRRTAYLCASQSAFKTDEAASALFQQYLGDSEVDEGMDVFCFDQVADPSKPKQSNRGKKKCRPGKKMRARTVLLSTRNGSEREEVGLAQSTVRIDEGDGRLDKGKTCLDENQSRLDDSKNHLDEENDRLDKPDSPATPGEAYPKQFRRYQRCHDSF
jgi:hypothetical protein